MGDEIKPVEPPTINSLRAATIGQGTQFKKELVEVGPSQFIEVRQPNVGQRGQILKAAKALSGDMDKLEYSELQVQAVIACSFVPGADAKVFTEHDYAGLMAREPGGFVDKISEVALRLLNVEAENVAKN